MGTCMFNKWRCLWFFSPESPSSSKLLFTWVLFITFSVHIASRLWIRAYLQNRPYRPAVPRVPCWKREGAPIHTLTDCVAVYLQAGWSVIPTCLYNWGDGVLEGSSRPGLGNWGSSRCERECERSTPLKINTSPIWHALTHGLIFNGTRPKAIKITYRTRANIALWVLWCDGFRNIT